MKDIWSWVFIIKRLQNIRCKISMASFLFLIFGLWWIYNPVIPIFLIIFPYNIFLILFRTIFIIAWIFLLQKGVLDIILKTLFQRIYQFHFTFDLSFIKIFRIFKCAFMIVLIQNIVHKNCWLSSSCLHIELLLTSFVYVFVVL